VSRRKSEVTQAHEAARWCLNELRMRGWRWSQVAQRMGVDAQTVSSWWQDRTAPRTEAKLQQLIGITRAVLQDRPPVLRLCGMHWVAEMLRRTLGLSSRAFSRRLGLGAMAMSRWISGGELPGQRATAAIRALVIEVNPPEARIMLNICDARLKEIGNETARQRERFRRLRDASTNWAELDRLKKLAHPQRLVLVLAEDALNPERQTEVRTMIETSTRADSGAG
jgi:DNA-binding transcriptional regulator YiaG